MKNEDIVYIKKIFKFGTYTLGTIAGVFSSGILMDFLNFDDKNKTLLFKKYLDNWGEKSLNGVTIKSVIDDESIFKSDENFLFLSNHRSIIDVLAIFATTPKSIRFVAKKSLFKIPIFSHAMRYVGMFEINRKNKEDSIKTLKIAAKRLKEGSNSISMFPEGTRNKGKGLLPFKKGAFHLAVNSKVSIIPVSIVGTEALLEHGSWKMKDGEIKIYYGSPIETKLSTVKDIPKLMKEVENAILNNLIKLGEKIET